MTFDLLLRGGLVLDGTDGPPMGADVAVRDGRIVAVGKLPSARASLVLDVDGRAVCPGFIDMHGHSDFGLLEHPSAESQVAQGITTEVIGQCGTSAFPMAAAGRELYFYPEGVEMDWSTAAQYFDRLRQRRPAINVASLVGHGAVRAAAMGLEERPPTASELQRMRELVDEAMRDGAFGLSSGLHFEPSHFADAAELAALCQVVAASGGAYFAHMRDYGRDLLPAIDETISIAGTSGARAHISLLHIFGRDNWGQATAALRRLEEARAGGIDVAYDSLAYPTVGAWWAPRAVFPPDLYDWRRDNVDELAQQLSDPDRRRQLSALVEERRLSSKRGFHQEYLILSDWRDIVLEGVGPGSPNMDLVGRSVAEAASRRGVEPVDLFFDLLVAERRHLVAIHYLVSEADHSSLIASPLASIGCDGIATSPEDLASPINRLQQHPRHWGSFPHFLGTHVREKRLLSLSEAVRKAASVPARRLGLADRGLVREGCWADLVVFDPATVEAGGGWRDPCRYPVGIDYVLVNGALAVERGRPTGTRAGHVLSHGR